MPYIMIPVMAITHRTNAILPIAEIISSTLLKRFNLSILNSPFTFSKAVDYFLRCPPAHHLVSIPEFHSSSPQIKPAAEVIRTSLKNHLPMVYSRPRIQQADPHLFSDGYLVTCYVFSRDTFPVELDESHSRGLCLDTLSNGVEIFRCE